MRRLFILGLVIALAGLAGCIGGDEAQDPNEQTPEAPLDPSSEEPDVDFEDSEALYTFQAEPHREVRWENDSFSPASCFACPDGEHRYDVTGMLADGAPTHLRAELDASTNLVDATDIWIETEGATPYRANDSFEESSRLVGPHASTVEVVVYNYFPDANTEVSYELRVEATANASRLPAYAPVELPRPEDPPSLAVDGSQAGDEARLMLWDGQDQFLGHHTLEEQTTINVSEAEGPLVAYLAGAEGSVLLAPGNASDADTTMRPLTLGSDDVTESVGTHQQIEIEAPIEQVPLQAGVFLQGSYDVGTSYSGQLQAGNETILSFESGGYITGSDSRFTRWSEPGAAELGPVDYLATFEFSASSGGEAGVVWLTHQR